MFRSIDFSDWLLSSPTKTQTEVNRRPEVMWAGLQSARLCDAPSWHGITQLGQPSFPPQVRNGEVGDAPLPITLPFHGDGSDVFKQAHLSVKSIGSRPNLALAFHWAFGLSTGQPCKFRPVRANCNKRLRNVGAVHLLQPREMPFKQVGLRAHCQSIGRVRPHELTKPSEIEPCVSNLSACAFLQGLNQFLPLSGNGGDELVVATFGGERRGLERTQFQCSVANSPQADGVALDKASSIVHQLLPPCTTKWPTAKFVMKGFQPGQVIRRAEPAEQHAVQDEAGGSCVGKVQYFPCSIWDHRVELHQHHQGQRAHFSSIQAIQVWWEAVSMNLRCHPSVPELQPATLNPPHTFLGTTHLDSLELNIFSTWQRQFPARTTFQIGVVKGTRRSWLKISSACFGYGPNIASKSLT